MPALLADDAVVGVDVHVIVRTHRLLFRSELGHRVVVFHGLISYLFMQYVGAIALVAMNYGDNHFATFHFSLYSGITRSAPW